jgi:hypothetical protein
VVFNRKSSYLPFFETKGERYYFDEIIKRNGDGTDKKPDADNKYSYVRIIKNTAEEILIHWRYMPDIHNDGFTGVVHEYFHFYLDSRVKREIKEGFRSIKLYIPTQIPVFVICSRDTIWQTFQSSFTNLTMVIIMNLGIMNIPATILMEICPNLPRNNEILNG